MERVDTEAIAASFLPDEGAAARSDDPPELVMVVGPVCAGKSTHVRENFGAGWILLDAGEIFLRMTGGNWSGFGKRLEDELEIVGRRIVDHALRERRRMVTELLLDRPEHIAEIVRLFKAHGYAVKMVDLDCEEETALQRNGRRNAAKESISAWFTESYHINWILDGFNRLAARVGEA